MGKRASDKDEVAFLVRLQHVYCAEAARRAGLTSSTNFKIKDRAAKVGIRPCNN